MSRWSAAGVVAVLLGGACTAPVDDERLPEVADARLEDNALAVMPAAARPLAPNEEREAEAKPEAEAEPDAPSSVPRVVVSALDPELDVYTAMLCPFGVAAVGFPAISADGSTVVTQRIEASSGSEGDDDEFYVDWTDAASGTTSTQEQIYDAWRMTEAGGDDPEGCAKFHRSIQRKAKEVNAKLASQSWRALPELGVYLADANGEYDGGDWPDPVTQDAKTRPVEVLWQRGRIVGRVRKVKVLFDEPAPWFNDGGKEPANYDNYDPYDYNPCEYEPVLHAIHGDAITGLVMVSYDHDRPETSCMCDGMADTAFMTVPAEFFAQIERRPLVERES